MTRTTYDHVDAALGLIETSGEQARQATDPGLMAQAQVAATIAQVHATLALVERLDEIALAQQQAAMAAAAATEAYEAQVGACQHPADRRVVSHDIEGGRVVRSTRCGVCGESMSDPTP